MEAQNRIPSREKTLPGRPQTFRKPRVLRVERSRAPHERAGEHARVQRLRAESGERLTTALTARVPGLSRSGASRLVAGKNARVDGVRVSSDVRLAGGETVDAFVPDSLVRSTSTVPASEYATTSAGWQR